MELRKMIYAISENMDRISQDAESIGAVVFVEHNANDMITSTIEWICQMKGIPLIVDSAQSIGNTIYCPLRMFTIYSFSVPKLITYRDWETDRKSVV